MTLRQLVLRNLIYFRRTNLAVIAGVAAAVAVLAGALLIGTSVRASLARLALDRLGKTHTLLSATHLFREQLADSFPGAAPLLTLDGVVTHQSSRRRAGGVALYGVDDRFWRFHDRAAPQLGSRGAALSAALAAELNAKPGDTLLVRVEKPTDIPAESLFGRKDDVAPAIRATVTAAAPDFSLRPDQGPVRAVFLPLSRVQKEIDAAGRANALLLTSTPRNVPATLEDLGLRLTPQPDGTTQLDSRTGVLSDDLVRAASLPGSMPSFTYLATTLRIGNREAAYALVAALDLARLPGKGEADPEAIVLNEWAARDLNARAGDSLTMEYLRWHDDGRLTSESARFRVAAITPITGLAADRNLTPRYPGITDADNVSDWDPPFPMNLSRIRPRDEDYWDRYRTTPKAFIPFERAAQLWSSRWGKVTALRANGTPRLQLDPLKHGFALIPLRDQALSAAQGATDFGEYFLYFSFFLMLSALALAALFFRLGVEQRLREIGLLEAIGFGQARIAMVFLAEGLALAVAGALLGIAGGLGYAAFILFGLRTWWVDAVGTQALTLAPSTGPLAGGAIGGVVAALAAIAWTLRSLRGATPRNLLAGVVPATPAARSRAWGIALTFGTLAAVLLIASAFKALAPAAGFFGGGLCLLIAAISALKSGVLRLAPVTNVTTLAFRNASIRPGRTALTAGLIAAATFLIVSVEAFRKGPDSAGTGGYPLIAESVRPLYYDPNSAEGREAYNLTGVDAAVKFVSFRLRPGDDASCLNLYQPRNPRILGAPESFLRAGRFAFAGSAKAAANPWLLLTESQPDGAIPAVADLNSLTYVLHKKLGDTIEVPGGPRLRIVATLADSILQSELVISEPSFLRAFPSSQGYRVFLIDVPRERAAAVLTATENALSDHGFDATSTEVRLASFHRVENTYLSTFQSLGALGLLLGTIGLAAVLIRNVLERRREFALLAAVGFSPSRLSRIVLIENVAVLAVGLGTGAAAALLAVTPALAARHQAPPGSILILLALVFATGLLASWLATRAALRLPLLPSLRAE